MIQDSFINTYMKIGQSETFPVWSKDKQGKRWQNHAVAAQTRVSHEGIFRLKLDWKLSPSDSRDKNQKEGTNVGFHQVIS